MKSLKALARLGSILGAFIILLPWPAISGMTDYCSVPPFLSNTVPPNILIVLDNSGSMNFQAYATTYDPAQFASGQYYGLFDATKYYQYTNSLRWEPVAGVTTTNPIPATGPQGATSTAHPIASGNFLNWATMSRLSVAKKLLIGGKANPRSPSGAVTVKLEGESAWGFTKTYDNTTTLDLIAPFQGNHSYQMSSAAALSIIPVGGSSSTVYTVPSGDISNPPAWTKFPSTPTTGWDKVDDTISPISNDGDATYIQAQNTASPALFDYNYTGGNTGTITKVSLRVVAKRSSGSSTRRIQGVLNMSGTDFPSSYSNLSSSYGTYTFDWTTNPATGAAWAWSDIKSVGVGNLQAFGVKANQAYASLYPRVTQVSLVITTSTPSGGPYNIIVDQGMKPATGIIDNLSSSAKFGLMYYNLGDGIESGYANGNHDGGEINTYIDFGSTTSMITSINNKTADTWTPLGETLYEGIRYFRQDAPFYTGNTPPDYQTGNNYDPYYYQYSKVAGLGLSDRFVPCAKSFVLMLTDGESGQDTNIPVSIKGLSSSYRFAGTAPGTTYQYNGTDYLIDVARWARTTDHRTLLNGNQNVVIYPVFMFGQGSTLLKDTAINGGFNDLNSDGAPGPAIEEYLRDSNEDGSITTADDPITYFEGDDGFELEEGITDAVISILKRAGSGTAVSVLTTSSRNVSSLLQAYFYPVRKYDAFKSVSWIGYLQNLWVDPKSNLREDAPPPNKDLALRLDQDRIAKIYFDTANQEAKVGFFSTDVNGKSAALDSCTPNSTASFSALSPLFEAGERLATTNPSARKIFTSTRVVRGTGVTSPSCPPSSSSLTPPDCFTTSGVMGDPDLMAALNADTTYSGEEIIRYVRGECLESGVQDDTDCGSGAAAPKFRDRRVPVAGVDRVWKLGDIISSTPKQMGSTPNNAYVTEYGDASYYKYVTTTNYRDRSAISIVGANDGMLHAFRVGYLKDRGLGTGIKALYKNAIGDADLASGSTDGIGKEVWGFIPFNAFPYLKYLADPNYCHIYYNDLPIKIVDASLGGASAATRNPDGSSWRTIVIGGMRYGGACSGGSPSTPLPNVGFSSYYAIDITNPEVPVPLWEFSDVDMGYAAGAPAVLRTGDKTLNGHWYLAIGSGSTRLPKANTDIERDRIGRVYILDMETGTLVKKIDLDHNAIVGGMLPVDVNRDYRSEAIYFGTSYKEAVGPWKGKLMKLDIPDGDLTSASISLPTALFEGDYPFTTTPEAARYETQDVWVYAGSGKYLSDVDEADKSDQIFIGIIDKSPGIPFVTSLTRGNLDERTGATVTGSVRSTELVCLYNKTATPPAFANQLVVTEIDPSVPPPGASTIGWYVLFRDGERLVTRPLSAGGLVNFISYIPSADLCSYGGDSKVYAVEYHNGTPPASIALRSPDMTGGVTTGTVTVSNSTGSITGAPPQGEGIIMLPPKDGDDLLKQKIQIGTTEILEAEVKPPISLFTTVMHWMKR